MTLFVVTPSDSDLMHHGVKGQKWGVRRYQNKDGSLTALGKSRQHGGKEMTEEEVQKALKRRFTDYDLTADEYAFGRSVYPWEIKFTESLIRQYGDKPYRDIENPQRIEKARKAIEKSVELREKAYEERDDIVDEYDYRELSDEEERIYKKKLKTVNDKIRKYDVDVSDNLVSYRFFSGNDVKRRRAQRKDEVRKKN